MSVHYSPDLSALADRPDFDVSLPEEPEPGRFQRMRRLVAAAAVFLGATFATAVVFFIPVFIYNLSRIEALEVAGRLMPASVFADQLGALFWGTFILALAFTSFVVSLLMLASNRTLRPVARSFDQENALTHLAVLRLSGSER